MLPDSKVIVAIIVVVGEVIAFGSSQTITSLSHCKLLGCNERKKGWRPMCPSVPIQPSLPWLAAPTCANNLTEKIL